MMKHNLNIKIISFCSLVSVFLWSGVAFGATQVLTFTENKRLEANIAANMMNRLAVTNDRIVNVFGDDGTFITQTDDHTGQVFIKATPENASLPISITLITENGLTQDLMLHPVESKASTIILKALQSNHASQSPQSVLLPGFSKNSEGEQEQWIALIKQAVLGELPEFDGKHSAHERKATGFQLKHEKNYDAKSGVVQVWCVKNMSRSSQTLLEKLFHQPGDIALSLQKRALQPNEKTLLYILRAV
jgi:type-F conjugative transfer system secretin TraK